jgi:hypothetical protein
MENQIETIGTNIDRIYYVSTSLRESSSLYCPIKYYELLVWTLENGQLNKIIYQGSGRSSFKTAYKEHMRLVKIFTYLVERELRKSS